VSCEQQGLILDSVTRLCVYNKVCPTGQYFD